MRLDEILNESITFEPCVEIEYAPGKKAWSSEPFQQEDPNGEECWACDGSGIDIQSREDNPVPCGYCKGSKRIPSYIKHYNELNVSNSNGVAIAEILGMSAEDYSGLIPHEQLVDVRRKLIRLKNGDLNQFTDEPTVDQGGMRRYTDDNGMTAIGRGPKVYYGGRSNEQVMRYIDSLLALIDFCQKNNAALGWG